MKDREGFGGEGEVKKDKYIEGGERGGGGRQHSFHSI